MTTQPGDLHYPSHAHHDKKELTHLPRRGPKLPDFRFEWSYLRSVRPYVHVERLEPARSTEKGKDKDLAGREGEGEAAVVRPQEHIEVNWARLIWITTRDQMLSPFAQGAVWGVAAFYLKPLLSGLGRGFRAWWARGGTSDPRRRIEGHGVSWLRNWVSSVTTPNVHASTIPK